MCVLDVVNKRSLEGFGCESFEGVTFTGFTDGDYLWKLSLGRTGDGKFDGETFLVGCGWFFWKGRGEEEESSGHVNRVGFVGRHALLNSPIFFRV